MAGLIVATPILPTSITSASMNAYFLNGLLRVKENVEADLKATTATWKTKHPKFKVMVRYAGGDARVIGDTDGASLDNDIWHYINEGTSVRYATMTSDFQPKTRKRNIGSMAGAGGMMYVSKKNPRPGIEAREFTDAIRENNEELLHKEMIKAVDNALTKGKFGVFR